MHRKEMPFLSEWQKQQKSLRDLDRDRKKNASDFLHNFRGGEDDMEHQRQQKQKLLKNTDRELTKNASSLLHNFKGSAESSDNKHHQQLKVIRETQRERKKRARSFVNKFRGGEHDYIKDCKRDIIERRKHDCEYNQYVRHNRDSTSKTSEILSLSDLGTSSNHSATESTHPLYKEDESSSSLFNRTPEATLLNSESASSSSSSASDLGAINSALKASSLHNNKLSHRDVLDFLDSDMNNMRSFCEIPMGCETDNTSKSSTRHSAFSSGETTEMLSNDDDVNTHDVHDSGDSDSDEDDYDGYYDWSGIHASQSGDERKKSENDSTSSFSSSYNYYDWGVVASYRGSDSDSHSFRNDDDESIPTSVDNDNLQNSIHICSLLPDDSTTHLHSSGILEQSRSLRDIMFNSDMLGPLPGCNNNEIEEYYFDAEEGEPLDADHCSSRMTRSRVFDEPKGYSGVAKEDNTRTRKVVRFLEDQDNHLFDWHQPENHHRINNTNIISRQTSDVLDIYNESMENPFNETGGPVNTGYSKEDFYKTMYTDELSSSEYDSEEDDSFDKKTGKGILGIVALNGIAAGILKLVSNFRNKSDGEGPINENFFMGTEIAEDAAHAAELAADSSSAFNASASSLNVTLNTSASSLNVTTSAASSGVSTTSASMTASTSASAVSTTTASTTASAAASSTSAAASTVGAAAAGQATAAVAAQ